MASQVPNQGSPNRGGPKVVPGESARRVPGPAGTVRGRMNAPAPNNRMPAPHPNQRKPSTEGAAGRNRPSEQTQTGARKGRNPTGSPTPNQRNSQPPRRSPQSPQRKGEPQPPDEAARAALALAAVAQAASASNKSPAEAAEIAKAQAHHISKKQTSRRQVQARPEPRKIQSVNLESVKGLLRSEVAAGEELKESTLLAKLADGGNDPFFQHLLMIEYLRAEEDDGSDLNASLSQMEDMKTENMKTAFACDRVKMLLDKAECAFNSLHGMMPHVHLDAEEYDPYSELDDMDTPKVVPDLLPPCTSKPGDATLEFFKACMGDHDDNADTKAETETTRSSIDDGSSVFDLNAESVENKDAFVETQEDKQGTSMLSSMFSMKRPTFNRRGFASVFGKKRKGGKNADDLDGPDSNTHCEKGEYTVQIEREMLGLTVENVLERTVVRTVLPGGPAKKAGAKVGSLIVKVGNIETKNLTHFETIDELRQSQRPLQLVLRQISDEALRSAREEMGRLIRGSGFGKIFDGEPAPENKAEVDMAGQRIMVGGDKNVDMYTAIMRKRWVEAANMSSYSKKDEPILRVGEKLVWILTLFIIGLERESERLFALAKENEEVDVPDRNAHSQYHHTAKDYADAAKSELSKVLFDFLKKRLDPTAQPPPAPRPPEPAGRGMRGGRGRGRGGRGGRGMTMADSNKADDSFGERLLLQIGDVLQRTRSFLADPTSPPAAMLRGEVIACLCDILDTDSEMKLSEEETVSQTQGGKTGPITDLGSAGSLLKLIVLNCPIMRSPGCEEISKENSHIDADELKRRFGEKQAISASDYHRLHAGNRFLAVVHRLAASRSTSARITACSLGPVLWSHLDFPHQLQLRGVITRALHDVEVIVRKSTATVLHEIAELVFDPRCVPWLVLMCERAMTDPEPLLRSAAMTLTWHLADHLPNAFLGDASKGSRYLRRLPNREDPIFPDVYLLQCKLLPVATRLAEDRAPQVRLAVAAQCERLCDALGGSLVRSSVIIDVLVALLTDSDERVRSEAVLCVPRLADVVLLSSPPGVIPAGESSVLDALLPASIKLQKDSSASVRIALATAAGEMLTLLVGLQRAEEARPKESEEAAAPSSIRFQKRHVDDRLIPLVQTLLHDADPEVTSSALRAVTNASRGNAREIRARIDTEDDDSKSISSVQSHISMEKKDPVFLPVLSEEQVLRLLPTLSELANSKQWRVRQSAVEIVPALLGCTTKFETRADIARLCIRLTGDKVDAVRRTAAECLCLGGGSLGSHGDQGGEDLGGEWITALVIPQIQTCAKHSDYRQRLLCLKMVEVILLNGVCPPKWKDEEANAEGKNSPLRELLKVTLSLAEDRIANVRLNVGKVLGTVVHVFGEQECRVIKYALLQQLKKENASDQRQDRDVVFFANKCLEKLR
eukprot:CAMPEP_0117081158 /NCGR_PEP_ID=MMETSP0472-20121206/57220_1 /TAXON_ID=693140 ORGANISM="Tiarina fusus, Strain LIS" /NCGR_SAMPLE_ID=MMETSP0472 /ASSEMBLY_ACC=CAM_ASM_000603 /LENGTH=1412 /DNA_ID=CAMNT_0004809011 /DNA_START=289 /DNA_END=4525 /DNA_ORIENTATION=+